MINSWPRTNTWIGTCTCVLLLPTAAYVHLNAAQYPFKQFRGVAGIGRLYTRAYLCTQMLVYRIPRHPTALQSLFPAGCEDASPET